jgi:ribA/ribD-fused uncharacterized protein
MSVLDVLGSAIESAESLLDTIKPITLSRYLVDLFQADTVADYAAAITGLLELYGIFWKLNTDKLVEYKDALFHAVRLLPDCLPEFKTFILAKATETCANVLLNQSGDHESSLRSWLTSMGVCVDSEWTKPLIMIATAVIVGFATLFGGTWLSGPNGWRTTDWIKTVGQTFKNGEFAITGIKSLYTLVLQGIGSIFDIEFDTPKGAKLALIKRITAKTKDLESYKAACEEDMAEVMLDPSLFDKISRDMTDIMNLYEENARADQNMSNVKPLLDHLKELYALLSEQRKDILSSLTGKQQPAVLWIAGETGVGKSRLVKDIVEQLARLEAGTNPARILTTYTRSVGDKFWSKYCGQDVVIYDDFGSSKKDEDHFELNQIFTENSYGLNMADVGSKGASFTSRYVIICSNFKHINRSEGIHNPDILNRRRDLLIDMRSNALREYKQLHGKMPPPSWYTGWDHVQFHDTPTLDTGRAPITTVTSIDAIVRRINQIQVDQRRAYKTHVRQVLDQFKIQQRSTPSSEGNLAVHYNPRQEQVAFVQPGIVPDLNPIYIPHDDHASDDDDYDEEFAQFLAEMENESNEKPKKSVSFAPKKKIAYIQTHKWTWEKYFQQTPRLVKRRKAIHDARKLHRCEIDRAYQQIQQQELERRRMRRFRDNIDRDIKENSGINMDNGVPTYRQSITPMPSDDEEWEDQGFDHSICATGVTQITANRIPITLLVGPPGTGKTFVLRALSQRLGCPILSGRNTELEIMQAQDVLLDEVAETPKFFNFVKQYIWAQYDQPSVTRVVMTANGTALEARLANFDSETRTAFMRRVSVITFDFQHVNWWSWRKYTHADCHNNFEQKVIRYKTPGQNLSIHNIVEDLSKAVISSDHTLMHHQLMVMPCTWYNSHVIVDDTLLDFYLRCREVTNPLLWATKFGHIFKIQTGNFLDVSQIAGKIFGAMHSQGLIMQEDPHEALVAFNNAKVVIGRDSRTLLSFKDKDFIIISMVEDPSIIFVRDNDVFYEALPDTIVVNTPDEISHQNNPAFRSIILKYDDQIGTKLQKLKTECNAAIEDEVYNLPELAPLNKWMKMFAFFVKLTIGGILVKRNVTPVQVKQMMHESWGSDMEDEPEQDMPAYGVVQDNRKIPRSATSVRNNDIYDGDQGQKPDHRFKLHAKQRKRMGDTYAEGKTDTISTNWTIEAEEFHGKDNPLSNFFPCSIEWRDQIFKSVEHAYQYEKASRFKPSLCEEIISSTTASKAKQWGRCIEVPTSWHSVKAAVMRAILEIKFSQPKFATILKATGKEDLFHDVPDKFWGYPGQNRLGFILTSIREGLKLEGGGESDSLNGDPNQMSRRPHHRFKVTRDHTKMASEAMLDPQSGVVADLCSENAVEIWKGGMLMCYGLMLQGRLGVTVSHVVDNADNITVKHKDQQFDATVINANKFKDYALFMLSSKSREFRDLTGHLPTSGEIGKDLSGNPCILQTTIFKGQNYVQQRRIVYITAISTRSVEGKQRYGVTYEGHLEGYAFSPMLSKKGDCGSPLIVMNTNFQHKIVGIHCAASDIQGMSTILTSDILAGLGSFPPVFVDEMLNAAKLDEIEILPHQDIEACVEEDYKLFKIFGRLVDSNKQDRNVYTPTKSRVWKSPFHIDIPGADKFEPAALCHKDQRIPKGSDPMEIAMDKWSHDQPLLDLDLLNSVVSSIAEDIAWSIKSKNLELNVLTKGQALNRYTKINCSNPLYRNSSPGYPFKFWEGVSKKSTFMVQKDDLTWKISENEHGRRLHNAIDTMLDRAKKGIRTAVVFSGSLKDEPIKIKKIYDVVGTRSFAGSPLDYTIAHRMYFHAGAAAIAECRDILPPKVGIDPRTLEWHQLYCHLTGLSPYGFDADFARWDATVPRAIMERLPIIYNRMYKVNDPNWTQEDDNIRSTLHSAIHGPLLSYHNYVVQAPGGQVSGQPCTAIDNCLINMIYMAYIWIRLAKRSDPKKAHYKAFTENVRYAVYGDDNITSISESVLSWFNYQTFAAIAKEELNLDVTSAAKDDSSVPWKPISELTFLKRSFKKRGPYWTGPLDNSSFSKMLNWTKVNTLHNPDHDLNKVKYDPEVIGLTVECALEEACLKGQDFFDKIKEHLVQRCRQYAIPLMRIYSRDDYFRKVFHNMNASTSAFEAESSFKENRSD